MRSVDALRGLAALVVCLSHFLTRPESPLAAQFDQSLLARYGWMGVQSFFVISGFVVPLAMCRGGYRIGDIGTFTLKRLVRLDPPFLVSILVVLALNRLLPGTIDQPVPPAVTPAVLLGHVFYGFSHLFVEFDWLNSVYWTLEIEFQYYILIALLLPVLVLPARWPAACAIGGLLLLAFVDPSAWPLFHWGPVFCFGIVLFLRVSGMWSRPTALAAWLVVALVCWRTTGLAVTLVAASTTLAIALWQQPANVFGHLGRLSFSFYLVHVPIGGRLLVHAGRMGVEGVWLFPVFVLALAASLLAAHLLWRFVERPAQSLARRIVYSTRISSPLMDGPRVEEGA